MQWLQARLPSLVVGSGRKHRLHVVVLVLESISVCTSRPEWAIAMADLQPLLARQQLQAKFTGMQPAPLQRAQLLSALQQV